MAVLDFKELPEANRATGMQDIFEMFARELLEHLGFRILQGPSRGADGGKDLIIEESSVGVISVTTFKWLVSCKHCAFSGRSVRPDDETNVLERVKAAGCDGFIGFYSTLPSSGLSELLHRQTDLRIKFFDREEIERHLLATPRGRQLAQRYFPVSIRNLQHEPARLFDNSRLILCDNCGKDLLEPPSGIWVIWQKRFREDDGETKNSYVDMYFACKGGCDRVLDARIRSQGDLREFFYDGWDDIPDLTIPTVFITKVMSLINGLVNGKTYEPAVLDKFKYLLLATFQHVSRHLSDAEQEEMLRLQRIPSYLGGMEYSL